MKHSFTFEQFTQAVQNSRSIRQVLINLNISSQGGSYKTVYRLANQHRIDLSHLKGKHWAKGRKLQLKTSTEAYLSNEIPIGSFRLKNRLLSENLLTPICSSCNLSNWLNKTIPLELDHIDGDNQNNNLSNLRLLCPNCHAFTSTYRGKNKRNSEAS